MERTTFDWVRAPVVVLDRAGIVRQWNAECAARTGRAVAEVRGRPFWELVDPADADAVRNAFADGHAPDMLEVACPAPNGTSHRMRLASTVVHGGEGAIDAIVLDGIELSTPNGALALSESPAIWKHIFDHASWGVGVGTLDGRFAAVNEAFARMHGTTARALVGTAISDVFAPEERSELPERIREVHERGSLRWISEHVRADGSRFPVIIDATAVLDDDGKPAYRAVYLQDLTDRVRDETAFRELFEQAGDGVFVADLDGRYTDVNPAGCRMLGYAREELIGKTIVDLIPPDHVGRLDAVRDRLLRGDTDVAEWVLRRADGSWLPVELSAKILADGRWQAFVRDITERKVASDALAASEAKFRQIVSVAADAILSVDEDEMIVLFNEGAERTFGYRADEVVGKPLELLMPERFRAAHHDHLHAFAAGGIPARPMAARQPVRARRSNGDEFSAQASISQVVDRGRRVFTAVIRDVSAEVRALEEERFLGEVSSVLASSLDVEVTLAELSRLAVRHLADVCIVDFVHGSATRLVRAATRTVEGAELAAALQAFALDRRKPYLGADVWRTGTPELVEDVGPEYLAEHSQDAQHLELLRAANPRSLVSVPMRARGELRGVLTLVASARTYDRRDLQLAIDVASRAATALDNAALHDALTRAHADLGERLRELEEAQEQIRTLTGLLPVCAWCGLIRDEDAGGAWKRFDQYVSEHSSAEVTHSICPTCAAKLVAPPK